MLVHGLSLETRRSADDRDRRRPACRCRCSKGSRPRPRSAANKTSPASSKPSPSSPPTPSPHPLPATCVGESSQQLCAKQRYALQILATREARGGAGQPAARGLTSTWALSATRSGRARSSATTARQSLARSPSSATIASSSSASAGSSSVTRRSTLDGSSADGRDAELVRAERDVRRDVRAVGAGRERVDAAQRVDRDDLDVEAVRDR